MKKYTVFGASGSTGKEIVKQALDQGDFVYAFVRHPHLFPIKNDNLQLIEGDVMDSKTIIQQMPEDADAVLIALGAPPNEKQPVRSIGTNNIIEGMDAKDIKRLVCMTTLGMGETMDMLPASMKQVVIPMFLKSAFNDHKVQEEEIENSDTQWTIVRPSNLQNGPMHENYKVGTENSKDIKGKVTRADVANFMLKCAKDPATIGKKYWISD